MEGGRNPSATEPDPFSGWFEHPTAMDSRVWSRCLVAAAPPPGGVLLDPLCGSGTTVCAGAARGLRAIGLESLDHYALAARAKLTVGRDTATLRQAALHLVDELEPAVALREHEFVRRCFPEQVLGELVALRDNLFRSTDPWREHLVVALLGSLRDLACVQVGWPHPQPDRPRRPRFSNATESMLSRVEMMSAQLDSQPSAWSALGRIEQRDARSPFAWQGLVRPASVDAVITSPPYFNGFDYPEAARLEMPFANPDRDSVRNSRATQIAASVHHASAQNAIRAFRDLATWPRSQGGCRALCGALRHRRLSGRSTKPYDQLLPMYVRDLARMLGALVPWLRRDAAIVLVVATSAPSGVYVPVPRLVERLGEEMGFRAEGSETLRSRGRRWRPARGLTYAEGLDEELVLLRYRSKPRILHRAGWAPVAEPALAD